MAPPAETDVLIVGAGPAGMTAALSLKKNGVKNITIVDATEQGVHFSRAMVIHAATLEALDTIGVSEAIVEAGEKIPIMSYYDRASLLINIEFSALTPYTRFPFYVLIPQNKTEEILAEKLVSEGIHVHRPYRAKSMQSDPNGKGYTTVTFEDGTSIRTRYVVGADGAQSVIRKAAGINFGDPDGDSDEAGNLAQMVICDVTFTKPPSIAGHNILFGTLTTNNFFVFSPLPYPEREAKNDPSKSGIYRIASGVPLSEGVAPATTTKEYVQDLIDRYGPLRMNSNPAINEKPFEVEELVWYTRFRTRSAIASRFWNRFSGAPNQIGGMVNLIGDAAHIHPPAGGQGMNLGIRDAVTLGPAIYQHMEDDSHQDSVIQSYGDLRHERALRVIRIAKTMASTVGMSVKSSEYLPWFPFVKLNTIRDWVLWTFGKSYYVRRKLAYDFSGLGAP